MDLFWFPASLQPKPAGERDSNWCQIERQLETH
jgi:hypothetical protein